MENVTPVARSDIAPRFLQWSPIVLGALAATRLVGLFVEDWRAMALSRRARGIAAGRDAAGG